MSIGVQSQEWAGSTAEETPLLHCRGNHEKVIDTIDIEPNQPLHALMFSSTNLVTSSELWEICFCVETEVGGATLRRRSREQ